MSIRHSPLMGDIWLSLVIGVEERSRVISTFSIFLWIYNPRGLPNGLPFITVTAPAQFGLRTAEPSCLHDLGNPVITAFGGSVFPVSRRANPCRCRSIAALFWTSPGEAVDSCTRGRFPMSMSGVWIYHLLTGGPAGLTIQGHGLVPA